MTRDPLDVASTILAARPTGADLEVCVRAEQRREVRFERSAPQRVTRTEGMGVAVRVAVGSPSRVGFAATSDFSRDGVRHAVRSARDLASLAEPGTPLPEAIDPEQPVDLSADHDVSTPELLGELLSDAAQLGLEPVTAGMVDLVRHQVVLSSRGISASTVRRLIRVHLNAQVVGPGGATRQLLGVRIARRPDPSWRSGLAAGLAAELLPLRTLELVQPPTGLRLVLEPLATAKLLRPLGWALDGTAVRAGKSPLRPGSTLLPGNVGLLDDGRPSGGPLGTETDDEGVPTRRATLVSAGTVVALLDSWHPDQPDGGGHVRRFDWAERPRAALSNLRLSATPSSPPDQTGRFIQIVDLTGIDSTYNRATGDFSGQLHGIVCAADGTPEGMVKAPFAENIVSVLNRISWVDPSTTFFPMESAIGGSRVFIEPDRREVEGR